MNSINPDLRRHVFAVAAGAQGGADFFGGGIQIFGARVFIGVFGNCAMLSAGKRWMWVCGTSKPAIIRPMRLRSEISSSAAAMVWATANRCAAVAGGRSCQRSVSCRGTTSRCPSDTGIMSINATHSLSRQTKRAGISPAMILLKILAINCSFACSIA